MPRRFQATLLLGLVLVNLGSLCLRRSSAEFILAQSRLSSNHRCRSAITTSVSFLCTQTEKCCRVSSFVPRTGFRAVLLSAHQEKRCVISSSSETSRVVLCWNPRTQSRPNLSESSAHFEQCETCNCPFRTLCEVRELLIWSLRVLGNPVRYCVRHIVDRRDL